MIAGSPAFTAPEILEGKTPTPGIGRVFASGQPFSAHSPATLLSNAGRGEEVVAQFLRITSQPIPDLRETGTAAGRVRRSSSARWPETRQIAQAVPLNSADELRQVQRHNNLTVDEMAQPVDLSVERREAPGAEPLVTGGP